MLANIVLLFLVFGATKSRSTKEKLNPYVSAFILGVVKGGLYFIQTRSAVAATMGFVVFGGLAAGLVCLLARVDKKEADEKPYSDYGTELESSFKWEYIPLSAIVLLLIFGEMGVLLLLP